ncbi:protein translocase subunit secG [Orbus hercynius]|uniref:Protein-export membrane protein SecG n=1 Tax=Orbus hercynius TaxID=593135 RepID=A0A495RB21_9GAMM|nr:protein translocase subunit secG [Orbus hercynius]
MYEILIIVFLIVAIAIIGLVLIQKGKGADMGASFGAGASATLFGSAGTGNFLTRATTILGILFFVISIVLANIGSKKTVDTGFWNLEEDAPVTSVESGADQHNNQTNTIDSSPVSPTSDIPE